MQNHVLDLQLKYKVKANNDTKSAVNMVFHDSSTALLAANSKDLPTLISSFNFSKVTI